MRKTLYFEKTKYIIRRVAEDVLPYRIPIIVITVIGLVSSLLGIASVMLGKTLIDVAVALQLDNLVKFCIFFGIVTLIEIVIGSINSYYVTISTDRVKNGIQLKLLSEIFSKSWYSLSQYNTGDLMTRLEQDVSACVTMLLVSLPTLISLIVRLVLAFILLATYDYVFALACIIIMPISILTGLVIGKGIKKIQIQIQASEAQKRSLAYEALQNIAVVKTFNFSEQMLARFGLSQSEYIGHVRSKAALQVKSNFFLGFGFRLGIFGAMTVGAYRLGINAITFGTFTAFIQLIAQIQGPLFGLSQTLPQMMSSLASLERIDEIRSLDNDEKISNLIIGQHQLTSLELTDVSYFYTEQQPVLRRVNLRINRGEKVAVIGPSGEGKTTLIRLILSLVEPKGGTIQLQLNTNEYIPINASTRSYFAYVPQHQSLFSGTILSNLLLGFASESHNIEKALLAASCKTFIDQLPEGVNTIIGEGGFGLSQGQIQRIMIARALVQNRSVLILDEATSALDHETEKLIIENISNYYPHLTMIAITHRDGILSICDRIYKIEGHEIRQTNISVNIEKEVIV